MLKVPTTNMGACCTHDEQLEINQTQDRTHDDLDESNLPWETNDISLLETSGYQFNNIPFA